MKLFVEWCLLVVLVSSILVFGAVQPLVYPLAETSIFLLVLIVLFWQAYQERLDFPLPIALLPFVLLVALQIIPLPPKVISILSPGRILDLAPLGRSAGEAGRIALSVYPHDTKVALVKLLTYCGAFSLAAYSFDWQRRRSIVVRA